MVLALLHAVEAVAAVVAVQLWPIERLESFASRYLNIRLSHLGLNVSARLTEWHCSLSLFLLYVSDETAEKSTMIHVVKP